MLGRLFVRASLAAVVLAGATLVFDRAATAQAPAGPDLLARGAYLTGGAGQCSDCHGATLGGAPLHIPGPPGVPWATEVPSLRGLPMFATDVAATTFFTTGKLPNGATALGPMPGYRFNAADAAAIVAYLRSLK